MIYTLTTNPAIDMNITSDTISTEHVNRTRDAVYTPNGKGLNVSFTLKHYGVDSTILGFFGGFSGDYIVREADKICPVKPIQIDGITRVNVFLTTPEGEYKFPNAGAEVNRPKQEEMLKLIRGLDDLECLVISGSLPTGIVPSYYDELIEVVREKGAEFVLDISHKHLRELVEKEPLLIKPNDEEVAAIFGVDVKSEEDIISALHTIHGAGAKNILLTLGGEGAYFFNGEHVWHANAAKVDMLSTACAGDATLASFLSVWLANRKLVEPALTRAMATGANVAMSAGLGDFALVDQLAQSIRVEVVE
ncbi:MAG: 1-phosphofructokinase [Olsenella sp.]|jgi:1-phosphofructokinase/6-phosphofructokinase 2|nr:1-phosphofructokinase [Olsenella sp.]MCI1645125.1 1-phosphofructokinase [Olsenella sp.]MCI1792997.1 1-phosphofructokinase [Olsenella sp.]MCI1811936.1 1-phosphofructokinase [Olsenella sp.]MCI1878610.1 1-phosphofructokinase [Olsenella sp.]